MTAKDAASCCERLSQLDIQRLLKQDELDMSSNSISSGIALNLWFNDLLSIWPVSVDERAFISSEYKIPIVQFGLLFGSSIANGQPYMDLPVAFIGIGDRQYVAFTGKDHILDLKTGTYLPGTKIQFLETIQYNLTTLYMIRYLKCTNRPESVEAKNDLPAAASK